MNGRVKYSDPYPIIHSYPSTPSMISRTMKSVTNKQILINKEPEYKPLEVQVIHKRPLYVSNYNSISGLPRYNDQNIFYFEDKEIKDNRLPDVKESKIITDIKTDDEPKSKIPGRKNKSHSSRFRVS